MTMAKIHAADIDPTRPEPPHVKALPKLQLIKHHAEAQFSEASQRISLESLIHAFNAGYEFRKTEEAQEKVQGDV